MKRFALLATAIALWLSVLAPAAASPATVTYWTGFQVLKEKSYQGHVACAGNSHLVARLRARPKINNAAETLMRYDYAGTFYLTSPSGVDYAFITEIGSELVTWTGNQGPGWISWRTVQEWEFPAGTTARDPLPNNHDYPNGSLNMNSINTGRTTNVTAAKGMIQWTCYDN